MSYQILYVFSSCVFPMCCVRLSHRRFGVMFSGLHAAGVQSLCGRREAEEID